MIVNISILSVRSLPPPPPPPPPHLLCSWIVVKFCSRSFMFVHILIFWFWRVHYLCSAQHSRSPIRLGLITLVSSIILAEVAYSYAKTVQWHMGEQILAKLICNIMLDYNIQSMQCSKSPTLEVFLYRSSKVQMEGCRTGIAVYSKGGCGLLAFFHPSFVLICLTCCMSI